MDERVRIASVGDAEAIGTVSVTAWRETYAGIMPDDYLAALSIEQRARVFRDRLSNMPERQAIFVGLDVHRRVGGFGACGPTREAELGTDGEVFAINIVNVAKRQGLGLHLMRAMADALIGAGFMQAGLWVVEQNMPARLFYERLGGVRATQKDQAFGVKTVVELGYVWPNATDLRDRAVRLIQAMR